jgi:hypothetical protein
MQRKKEPSYIVGGNVNWCNHCGNQYDGSSEKLKTKLPYNCVQGIDLPECKSACSRDTCTPMFIA